jgi:hypothetical protein
VTEDVVPILETMRRVAEDYELQPGLVKPCVGYLLDGNLGGAARHDAGFIIAIDLRGAGLDQASVENVLERWAGLIGYRRRAAQGAVRSAFSTNADGSYRYHPPGLRKQEGTKYRTVLGPVCEAVGCPANCPPLRHTYVGHRGDGADRFEELGWTGWLRAHRWRAACDIYLAICRLERFRGLPSGAPVRTSYERIAPMAEVNARTVGRELYRLETLGLISFNPGSGSGPRARDRVGSLVRRVIPIPRPGAPSPDAAMRTVGGSPSQIGGRTRKVEPGA